MGRIGDYDIERESEDGFEARHVVLPRRVRLTVIDKAAAVRMMREACILEALRHPGVPRVYEVGVMTEGATQRSWVASELVTGESIATSLRRGDVLAVDEILDLVAYVAEILAHAHARNVAHRCVRTEAIIRRDDVFAGSPLCLVSWSEARVPVEDAERAFADDVFALGLVADLAINSRDGVPPALQHLVDDMLAPNPATRPDAAAVVSRIGSIRSALDAHVEHDIEELSDEALELVDEPVFASFVASAADAAEWRDDDWAAGTGTRSQRRKTAPPFLAPVAGARMRWTPASGVHTAVVATPAVTRDDDEDTNRRRR